MRAVESGGADSLVRVGVRAGLASTWAIRPSRVDLEGASSLKPPRLVCIRAPYAVSQLSDVFLLEAPSSDSNWGLNPASALRRLAARQGICRGGK